MASRVNEMELKNIKEGEQIADERFLEMYYHSALVPPMEESADTKAGELLRAVGIIVFRFYSYGEEVGGDYDTEYVNAAARFIQEIYHGTELAGAVNSLWGVQWPDTYRKGAVLLAEMAMDFIESNKELMTEDNEWDCLEFREPEDRQCDEDGVDEWHGVSLMEHDLALYPDKDWRR